MPRRPVKCPVGNHELTGKKVYVTNRRLMEFIQLRLKDFSSDQPICSTCDRAVREAYRIKMKRAIVLKQRQNITVSSSSVADSDISTDSYDNLVKKTPLNPQLRHGAKRRRVVPEKENSSTSQSVQLSQQSNLSSQQSGLLQIAGETSSSSNSRVERHLSTAATSSNSNVSATTVRQILTNTSTSSTSLFQGPSTSAGAAAAAAAARRRRSKPDDDDDEYMPSPNATNGTRLPHVQPIARRMVFVHANPDVMNAYLQGITGG